MMDTKKLFGILGVTLVASLTSNIVVGCLIRDVKMVGKEMEKYDRKLDREQIERRKR